MVAILLGLSYQNASVFYLSQIYQLQLLAVQNGTSIPPSQIPTPPIFSFSVWTSIAWSLSLIISLVCTVIATLLRQWARRHLQITQEPRGVRSRARVSELVAQGLEMPQLRRMSSVLLGLFHLSVGLFLSGFVSSINDNVVFSVALAVTSICAVLYYFVSVVPLFPRFHLSHTPFSSFVWFCWSRFVWLMYGLLYNSSLRLPFIAVATQHKLWEAARVRLSWTLRDTKVTLEDLAHERSSSLDVLVVSRVFNSLDGHDDMEQFLSAIPGFYNSGEVNKGSSLLGLSEWRIAPAIVSFMDRSLSSKLLTKTKRRRRTMISLRAMDSNILLLQSTFGRALQNLNRAIFGSVEFVGFALKYLRKDDSSSDPWVKDFAQCILAVAINRVRLDDRAWIDIADRYLKPDYPQYVREGHDIRLCNLIYLIRRLKVSQLQTSDQFEAGGLWGDVLAEALKFDVMKTEDVLQKDLVKELDSITPGVQPSRIAQSNARVLISNIRTAFLSHPGIVASANASSSAGNQSPVLEWLTPHNVQEAGQEAGGSADPDIINAPDIGIPVFGSIHHEIHRGDDATEVTAPGTRSSPHSDVSPLRSQHTPSNIPRTSYAGEVISQSPHLGLSQSRPTMFGPEASYEIEIRSRSPQLEFSPPRPTTPLNIPRASYAGEIGSQPPHFEPSLPRPAPFSIPETSYEIRPLARPLHLERPTSPPNIPRTSYPREIRSESPPHLEISQSRPTTFSIPETSYETRLRSPHLGLSPPRPSTQVLETLLPTGLLLFPGCDSI